MMKEDKEETRTVVINDQHPRFIPGLVLLHRPRYCVLLTALITGDIDISTFIIDSRHQGIFRDIAQMTLVLQPSSSSRNVVGGTVDVRFGSIIIK
jgi:hypothetical protein